MKRNFTEAILFICTLLSGLYAGTGFFVAMGGNPALKLMSDATFAEYWQHTDLYMAARMKIFGPLLLLTVLTAAIVLFKKNRPSFFCMLLAFAILVGDIAFTLSTNHPLNQLIQSWDLNNLPSNVNDIKWRVAAAFDSRVIFMISCFLFVLLAVWLRSNKINHL
ncbi:MAG: hypothetical protein H7Y86_16680 [Rhizobacter sp.]|nr:hypothetical protein [Ferruginibacter sp.]